MSNVSSASGAGSKRKADAPAPVLQPSRRPVSAAASMTAAMSPQKKKAKLVLTSVSSSASASASAAAPAAPPSVPKGGLALPHGIKTSSSAFGTCTLSPGTAHECTVLGSVDESTGRVLLPTRYPLNLGYQSRYVQGHATLNDAELCHRLVAEAQQNAMDATKTTLWRLWTSLTVERQAAAAVATDTASNVPFPDPKLGVLALTDAREGLLGRLVHTTVDEASGLMTMSLRHVPSGFGSAASCPWLTPRPLLYQRVLHSESHGISCVYIIQFGQSMLDAKCLRMGTTTKDSDDKSTGGNDDAAFVPLAGGHGIGLKQLAALFAKRKSKGYAMNVFGTFGDDGSGRPLGECRWTPVSSGDSVGIECQFFPVSGKYPLHDAGVARFVQSVKGAITGSQHYLCTKLTFPYNPALVTSAWIHSDISLAMHNNQPWAVLDKAVSPSSGKLGLRGAAVYRSLGADDVAGRGYEVAALYLNGTPLIWLDIHKSDSRKTHHRPVRVPSILACTRNVRRFSRSERCHSSGEHESDFFSLLDSQLAPVQLEDGGSTFGTAVTPFAQSLFLGCHAGDEQKLCLLDRLLFTARAQRVGASICKFVPNQTVLLSDVRAHASELASHGLTEETFIERGGYTVVDDVVKHRQLCSWLRRSSYVDDDGNAGFDAPVETWLSEPIFLPMQAVLKSLRPPQALVALADIKPDTSRDEAHAVRELLRFQAVLRTLGSRLRTHSDMPELVAVAKVLLAVNFHMTAAAATAATGARLDAVIRLEAEDAKARGHGPGDIVLQREALTLGDTKSKDWHRTWHQKVAGSIVENLVSDSAAPPLTQEHLLRLLWRSGSTQAQDSILLRDTASVLTANFRARCLSFDEE